MTTTGVTRDVPRPAVRVMQWVVALLVIVGVGSAIGRAVFPGDYVTRAESVRQWLLDAFNRTDPFALDRPAELARVDGRFAAHPLLTLVHVIAGGFFLLFAPLQFTTRVRRRYPALHRWSGRILLPTACVSVLASLYFGLVIPYGGAPEAFGIALVGGMFLFAVGRAYASIRRSDVRRHREWMIRAFAIAIAISTVRLVAILFDGLLTPSGVRPQTLFVLSIWTGWALTIGAAEMWIRFTRAR